MMSNLYLHSFINLRHSRHVTFYFETPTLLRGQIFQHYFSLTPFILMISIFFVQITKLKSRMIVDMIFLKIRRVFKNLNDSNHFANERYFYKLKNSSHKDIFYL